MIVIIIFIIIIFFQAYFKQLYSKSCIFELHLQLFWHLVMKTLLPIARWPTARWSHVHTELQQFSFNNAQTSYCNPSSSLGTKRFISSIKRNSKTGLAVTFSCFNRCSWTKYWMQITRDFVCGNFEFPWQMNCHPCLPHSLWCNLAYCWHFSKGFCYSWASRYQRDSRLFPWCWVQQHPSPYWGLSFGVQGITLRADAGSLSVLLGILQWWWVVPKASSSPCFHRDNGLEIFWQSWHFLSVGCFSPQETAPLLKLFHVVYCCVENKYSLLE